MSYDPHLPRKFLVEGSCSNINLLADIIGDGPIIRLERWYILNVYFSIKESDERELMGNRTKTLGNGLNVLLYFSNVLFNQ